MDTDNLSLATYDGIIIAAERFNHDLTLQFGVLASSCKDDDDYLNKAEKLIDKWMRTKYFQDIEDYVFYGARVDEEQFKLTLLQILANIEEIRKTPMEEREYEEW